MARTIVDLADVLGDRRFADAVHESEVLRLFDRNEVDKTLERLPGRKGRHRVERILAAYRPDPSFTRSRAERRFLRLCVDHGLPKPSTNLFIGGHELDARREDRRRDRHLGTFGIQANRVTWRDLDDQAALAAELKSIRAQRVSARRAA